MAKGKNRFSLCINGRVIKYYQTERGATNGLYALYDNGKVNPDDKVTIYDGWLHCDVY